MAKKKKSRAFVTRRSQGPWTIFIKKDGLLEKYSDKQIHDRQEMLEHIKQLDILKPGKFEVLPTSKADKMFMFLYDNPNKRWPAHEIARISDMKLQDIRLGLFDLDNRRDPRIGKYKVPQEVNRPYFEYLFTHKSH